MDEPQGPPTRRNGLVKWFNSAKGFGFITVDGSDEEVFVHQSNIDTSGFRSLREGEEVEFDLMVGEDGKHKAFHVTGPDGAPPLGSADAQARTQQQQQQQQYPSPGGGPGHPGGAVVRSGPYDPNYAAAAAAASAAYNVYQQQHAVAAGRGRGSPGTPPSGYYPAVPPEAYMGYYMSAPGPYGAYPQPMFARGAGGGGRGLPGGGQYFPGGKNWVGARPPPPGQPGFSSGLQVVVHNLPWDCTWQQLKEAFSPCGEIERTDVVFDSRGRSRGFGIVRFLDSDVAETAVEKMNNQTIGGRVVSVRIDRFA